MVSSSRTPGSDNGSSAVRRVNGNARARKFVGDDIEALRLARGQDQQQSRARRGDFSKGFDHRVVFIHVARRRGRHGAGGDPHLFGPGLAQKFRDIGRDPGQPAA